MNARRTLCVAIGLASAPVALPALAQQSADGVRAAPVSGLTELSDEEMGDMRGRYTVGDNKVAWFGVTMVSTWQTDTGQTLQSWKTMPRVFCCRSTGAVRSSSGSAAAGWARRSSSPPTAIRPATGWNWTWSGRHRRAAAAWSPRTWPRRYR